MKTPRRIDAPELAALDAEREAAAHRDNPDVQSSLARPQRAVEEALLDEQGYGGPPIRLRACSSCGEHAEPAAYQHASLHDRGRHAGFPQANHAISNMTLPASPEVMARMA